jgi:hypothetical protein
MIAGFIAEAGSPRRQRVLCRFEDHRPFAYARGRDLIRLADHARWACLIDGHLVSMCSGERLAYQRDNVFYDPLSHEPVDYLSPQHPEPL